MESMISVLLVFSHLLFREGLKKIWNGQDIQVVGEAHTAEKALEQMCRCQPSIVLLEDQLPDKTGLSFCEMVHRYYPQIGIIFLIDQNHLPTLKSAYSIPCPGFLTKQACERSVEAIKIVYEGGTYLQPDLALHLLRYCINENQNSFEKLTSREYEVLAWLAQEKTYDWIAEHIHMGLKSVYNLKLKAFKKLNIQTREQLKVLLSKQ